MVFTRYWLKADVFTKILKAMSDDPEMEYAMVDVCNQAKNRPSTRRYCTSKRRHLTRGRKGQFREQQQVTNRERQLYRTQPSRE